MNQDNRNLVLAIVCSALLVIGYQIFYELPKQQALEEQALLEQKDLILTAPEPFSGSAYSSAIIGILLLRIGMSAFFPIR